MGAEKKEEREVPEEKERFSVKSVEIVNYFVYIYIRVTSSRNQAVCEDTSG